MELFKKWAAPIGALGIALIVGAFLLRLALNISPSIVLLLAGIGAVLVGFYFVVRPRDTTHQGSNVRIALQGGNVLLFALAFIGIVIAINYIVAKQFPQRLDVTANQQHTLSQQTVQILQNLQEPVQVTGFFRPQDVGEQQQAQDLLKEYQLKTNRLNVQFIDPDQNPAVALKYDNALPGTLVFEKGNRTEKVYSPFEENNFTNAILKVTQTTQPAVYFTTGHGEFSPSDTGDNGLSAVDDYLKQTNFKVELLNLATVSGTLPADTSAIVIAGPTKEFSAENDKLIKEYLDKGGRVLLMTSLNSTIGLTETLKAYGVELENNIVIEPEQNYYGTAPVPVFSEFPDSPVTANMQGLAVFFPGTRSIKKQDDTDKQLTALFTTTADACATTDFQGLNGQSQITCQPADEKGPLVVGYAIEGAGTGGASGDARARLIVLGNSSFVTNRWVNNQDATGNQQIIRNMVNWLAGQEELIAIPPRDSNVRTLGVLTSSELNLIFVTTAGLVPLAALVIGGMLWWRRR